MPKVKVWNLRAFHEPEIEEVLQLKVTQIPFFLKTILVHYALVLII